MKKLVEVTSYPLEGSLIISLSNQWLTLFKSLPVFDVFLDNDKRLHIISKQVITNSNYYEGRTN